MAKILLEKILVLIRPSIVLAAPKVIDDPKGSLPSNAMAITELIERLQEIVSIAAGIAAFGVVLWGATLYILAGGDADKLKQAKKVLTYGALGVIFILVANIAVQSSILLLGGTL